MIRGLVWGAPDPPTTATHQEVDPVRSKVLRTFLVLAPLTMVLVANGLMSPSALGQEGLQLTIIRQPADALVNETITSIPLNPNAGFVQVRARQTTEGGTAPAPGVWVTFELATGPGLATGDLHVIPQQTNGSGIATFGPGTLSIGTANESTLTNYRLIAVATEPPVGSEVATITEALVMSAPSRAFDVFQDGCKGTGCSVELRGGLDVYTTTQNVRLMASEVSASTLPGMECRNQLLVFAGSIFVHETSGSGAVGLVNHITAEDLGGGGEGVATVLSDDPDDDDGPRIGWCIGTKTRTPWENNGASFRRQDTNGDGRLDLFVGMAPRCPRENPKAAAPCIVSRRSDGEGGIVLTGWVPGGDPPRRT
jgi:hypothetical protein